jgi:hypothetical protein
VYTELILAPAQLVNKMWIWVAVALIFGFLLIFSNRSTKKHEKSSKNKIQWKINRKVSNQYNEEEMEEEDDLIDELLLIDLDEKEEEEY